jgi:hypothetical protein
MALVLSAPFLDVGNGRRGEAGLLAQRGVDLFHFAGADHHLEQATGEERTLDQVDLVEGSAVDQARVLQRQAQAVTQWAACSRLSPPPRLCSNSLAIVE